MTEIALQLAETTVLTPEKIPFADLHMRKIEHARRDDPDIIAYVKMLSHIEDLDHFRWPLLLDRRLLGWTANQMYKQDREPRMPYINKLVERLTQVVSDKRYLLLGYGTPPGKTNPEVVGGGLTDWYSESENQAWLNNFVVHPEYRRTNLGTRLTSTRVHEFFDTHPTQTNLYVGFNILEEGVSRQQAEALDVVYKLSDIHLQLENEGVVNRQDFFDRMVRAQDYLKSNRVKLPYNADQAQELFDYATRKFPITGDLNPTNMRVRRELIRGMLRAYGHETTVNEGVWLKFGAYLTQMLPEEVRAMSVVDSQNGPQLEEKWFPIRRLLLRREVWEKTGAYYDSLPITSR